MVIALVILFAAIAISVTWYMELKRRRALSLSPIVKKPSYQFKLENLSIPAGVYFSPTHSWAHLQTSGRARVGIDAFIQGLTGILSGINVPENGSSVKQGDPLFSLNHKGKELAITAPISGTIKAVNSEALQSMRLLHRNPYTHGWLVELEPNDWERETHRLYLGQRTTAWLKSEMMRIRDFFAHSFSSPAADSGLVLLQEGGEIAEGALAYSDRSLWEKFQSTILDTANSELKVTS